MNVYFYGYLQFQMMQNITGLCVVGDCFIFPNQPAYCLNHKFVYVKYKRGSQKVCMAIAKCAFGCDTSKLPETSHYSPCVCRRSETCTKYLCKTIVVHNY